MLKRMLMDPAFPDLVANWAASDDDASQNRDSANDNRENADADPTDPLLTMLGKLEVAATRLW
jgi:hypothetical protein